MPVAKRVGHAGNGHCPVDAGESFEYKLGGPRPSWTRPGGNILFTFYTATKSVLGTRATILQICKNALTKLGANSAVDNQISIGTEIEENR